MTNTALITGASSGIGTELARYHAARGGDLIITARREDRLLALKAELESAHGISVTIVTLDLGTASGAKALCRAIAKTGAQVDILINNAGFGGHGLHIDRNIAHEMDMIDVNIKALVELTHYFANQMAQRGRGKILNIGSTAGFVPGPQQAVYFATKAFVNSFSQAVNQELRSKGVTCTVLAPGYVETEFAQAANLEGTLMVKGGGKSAASAAKHGYDAMMKGKLITINQLSMSILMRCVVPFLPRRTILKILDKSQSK